MTDTKINIQEILQGIDFNDKDFYASLTDQQKKDFNMWITMRFSSSVKGKDAEHYLIMVNEFANINFSDLRKHPKLQWMLLSLCGKKQKQFHPWIAAPKTRKKSNKLYKVVNEIYPHLKNDEIELFLKLNDKDDIKELLEKYGWDDNKIREVYE